MENEYHAGDALLGYKVSDGAMAEMCLNVRDSDRLEAMALGFHSIESAISSSVKMSDASSAVYYKGKLVAIFGVKARGDTGIPWMIVTNAAVGCPMQIARASREVLGNLREMFPVLTNRVHSKNLDAQRFLKFLGFTLDDEPDVIEGSLTGETFYSFRMEA